MKKLNLNEMSIRQIKNNIFNILKLPEVQKYKIDEFNYENIPISIFERNGITLLHLKKYIDSKNIITFDLGINIDPIKKNVNVFLHKSDIFNEEAVSKSQARLFRIAKAVKDGKLSPNKAPEKAVRIAKTMSSKEIDKFAKTDDSNLPDRVKEYSQNIYPALGDSVMGTIGDASFIGPEGQRKGAAKKPIYKTPKSSIHYKKGRFPDDPNFYNKDNWETDIKKSYIADKSVPKNSIHNIKNIGKNENFGIPMSADGVIDGGPRSMDPVVGKKIKKKKSVNNKLKKIEETKMNIKNTEYEEIDNNTLEKIRKMLKLSGFIIDNEFERNGEYYFDASSKNYEGRDDKLKYKVKKIADKLGLEVDFDLNRDNLFYFYKYKNENFNEMKDYDDNIVPKTSIHYGERDKVPGQKNLKTEGDWKNNLTKTVINLNAEAEPNEPSLPVHTAPIGDTPEFPFAKEDGSKIYPIPGIGIAIKKDNEWIFNSNNKFSELSTDEDDYQGCRLGHGEPSINKIDIPCSKKPLIKKLLMYIKKEQNNLQEGFELKGEYNGKIVKLNTIYEGIERKFKVYIKNNESKILEINFGPKKLEKCGLIKNEK